MTAFAWHGLALRGAWFAHKAHPVSVIAAVACLVAPLAWWGGVQRARQHHDALTVQLAQLRQDLARPLASAVPRVDANEQNWRVLMNTLTPASALESPVRGVLDIARRAELEVLRADYRYECQPVKWVCAYRIELPLSGDYPALRWYAEQVLASWPQVSLDELQFRRDAVDESEVHVQMVFTVHLRGAGTPGAAP